MVGRGDVPILFHPHHGTFRARRHHGQSGDRHDGCPTTSPGACAKGGPACYSIRAISGEIARAGAESGSVRRPAGTVARDHRCVGLVRNHGPDIASRIRKAGVHVSAHLHRLRTVPGRSDSFRHTLARRAISAVFVAGEPVRGMPAPSCLQRTGAAFRSRPVGILGSKGPVPRVLRLHSRPDAIRETCSAVVAGGGRRLVPAMATAWSRGARGSWTGQSRGAGPGRAMHAGGNWWQGYRRRRKNAGFWLQAAVS